MTGLPGVCITCRRPVEWGGRTWREAGNRSARHACPSDRPTCGAWMRQAKERCARRPGHGHEHRTRYAMDNALERATGRRSQRYNGPDEYSVLIGYPAQRPVSRLYSEWQGACVAEYRRNA